MPDFVYAPLPTASDHWFPLSFSAAAKVPLYSILGMSFTFVFLFVLVDLLNYCDCRCTCCADEDGGARPWVESEVQVYLLGTPRTRGVLHVSSSVSLPIANGRQTT